MKYALAGLAFALVASPASGAECRQGVADAISVVSVTRDDDVPKAPGGSEITVTMQSAIGADTRALDATVWFVDRLGRVLRGYRLEDYTRAPATGTFTYSVIEAPTGGTSLTSIHMDDLLAFVCTKAAILDDGSVVNFGAQ